MSINNSKRIELFEPSTIVKEYQNEFIGCLSARKIDPKYKGMEDTNIRFFSTRLETSRKMCRTPDLDTEELNFCIKSLNDDKDIDPIGFINELSSSPKETITKINEYDLKRK